MNQSISEESGTMEERFESLFGDFFKTSDRVIQAKGHYETEYLHKTYPAVTRFHPNGDITQHPAKFDVSKTVKEGSVDERDVYVAEKQWKASELIKEFVKSEISQALTEERKELRERIGAMLLPVPNPYGKWVSVENVNKKIIGKILALLEEK